MFPDVKGFNGKTRQRIIYISESQWYPIVNVDAKYYLFHNYLYLKEKYCQSMNAEYPMKNFVEIVLIS